MYRAGPCKYWYCPGKCGKPHIPESDLGDFTCDECGYSYYIYEVQAMKVLIEAEEITNEIKSR